MFGLKQIGAYFFRSIMNRVTWLTLHIIIVLQPNYLSNDTHLLHFASKPRIGSLALIGVCQSRGDIFVNENRPRMIIKAI